MCCMNRIESSSQKRLGKWKAISMSSSLTMLSFALASPKEIDDVISQAQAARAALGSQRALFGDVQGNVRKLGDNIPVIRGVIGSIRRKRSRDSLILSAVVAACTLFLIIYWLSK